MLEVMNVDGTSESKLPDNCYKEEKGLIAKVKNIS